MKTMILTSMIAAFTVACGSESVPTETITSTNSAGTSTIETVRTVPPVISYPVADGYSRLDESTETCINGSPIYCESRFVAPMNCLKTSVILILVESEVSYLSTQEISMTAGENIVLRYKIAPTLKMGNWSNQSFTQFQCKD